MWVQVIVDIFSFIKLISGLLGKISITTKAPETTTAV